MVTQGCLLLIHVGWKSEQSFPQMVHNIYIEVARVAIYGSTCGIRFSQHSDQTNTKEAASTWNFLNLGPSVFSRLLLTLFISLCRCSRDDDDGETVSKKKNSGRDCELGEEALRRAGQYLSVF